MPISMLVSLRDLFIDPNSLKWLTFTKVREHFLVSVPQQAKQFEYLAFFYVLFRERNAIYSDFTFEKQTLAIVKPIKLVSSIKSVPSFTLSQPF